MKEHHSIHLFKLLFPGILFMASILLLLFDLQEIAYLLIGIALATVIVIHYEERTTPA